ncbi:HAD-IA family hydrolase [Pendulispora brunnea]|uniref:HAD-IA family hydrolase n=1 Tax=Pendulispora brunnea TaxID=2905690 RepID=A0ABZ2JVC8_9BACT
MRPPTGKAILFDLLTALLDSWTAWNQAAGNEAAGRRWRARYLELTYACGPYRPYEELVREAGRDIGLNPGAADRLEFGWPDLQPWSGATEAVLALATSHPLGIVTNCSTRLGRLAAKCIPVDWQVIVTAEEAGYYKPHPRPYELALKQLGVSATHALFVAGSGYDLFGTTAVGLPTYWHNRVGLPLPHDAPAPDVEARDLTGLATWVNAHGAAQSVPR